MTPPPSNRLKVTTCGVLVQDGAQLLLGHATRSPRWDIPKGVAEPGESFAAAAARELAEETGLEVNAELLIPAGVHAYLRAKDLALFIWKPEVPPDPTTLICRSMVQLPGGHTYPEFDRFAWFARDEALQKVGRNLARILATVM